MDTTPISLLERLRRPNAPSADTPSDSSSDRSAERNAAWDRFLELYAPLIYRWVCRIGLQDQDASDLVQEVFLILVKKLPTFQYDKERKSFRGWLNTTIKNRWKDLMRGKKARPQGNGASLSELPAPPGEPFEEPEYRNTLISSALTRAREHFGAQTVTAFEEYVVNGKAPQEVARMLGISVNAVYIAKSKVLRWLRGELGGLLD